MKILILLSLLFASCGESIEAGRQVYRRKQCVNNGDRGLYCKINLGRFNYCYEYMDNLLLPVNCDIYEEARRGVYYVD